MGTNVFGKIDAWLALWFAAYVFNTLAVSQTPCGSAFLYTCLWVASYMTLRCLPIERIGSRSLAYACAVPGLFQVAVGLGQFFGLCRSGHRLYKVTGNFFNPAPYGAFIAMMLVVVMARYKESKERALGVAALTMAVMLPAAWSRAALLACAVCMGLMYRTWLRGHWRWVAASAATAVLLLYLAKRGSADSRMLMMIVSLSQWAGHLWLGTGVGSYLHTLGEGQAVYFAGHPGSVFIESVGVADLPFNEPLRMAVEQGLVGLLPFAVAVALAACRLWSAGSPLFYALAVLLVFSLFSYPFTIPAFFLMLAFILAYAANIGTHRSFSPRMAIPLAASIAMWLSVYFMLSPRIEAEKDYGRFSHMRDKAFIKDYYELLPFLGDNPRFLFDFGSLLRDCGRYNDSNAMLHQGALLSSDPMFHILTGRNYEDMQEYAIADSMYGHAFRMVPNRIYPLYRQMKLYEIMQDTQRLTSKASEIIKFKVKVSSSTTKEMKQEALNIIKE